MDSPLTLHDFVLNLLSDSTARSAFEIDPEGALHEAGLSDITAADVQEVIPLVVDYAPIGDLAGLEDLGDLAPAGLDTDPAAAIQQLQAITDQLPVGGQPVGVDINIAAGGAITVHSVGLAPDPLALSDIGLGLGTGLTGDLSVTTDPAGTLDLDGTVGADGIVDVTTPVDTSATIGGVVDATGVVDTTGLVDATGTGVLDTAVDGVLGTVDITANTVPDGLLPHPVDLTDPLGQLDGLPMVDHPLQHVGDGLPTAVGDGGVGGAVDGLGDLTGGPVLGEHGVTGTLGATATHALDLPF
jgi:hypothetical protein